MAAHACWRRNDWEDVLFTDECEVMVDSSDKRQHLCGRNGERFIDACIREVDRWSRACTMIWSKISYGGKIKTDLVFYDDDFARGAHQRASRGLTAQRYIDDVLRPVAVPIICCHPGIMLQHDNSRPKVARLTTCRVTNLLSQSTSEFFAVGHRYQTLSG